MAVRILEKFVLSREVGLVSAIFRLTPRTKIGRPAGGLRPSGQHVDLAVSGAGREHPLPPKRLYLISTVAPASVNFFLIVSASSLFTPSLTGFGAASTKSLASFSPRLVISRTTLITPILLPPTAVRTTLNPVFSSAGAAAAPPPPPAAGAAATAAA